jgi:hypothetical protein
MTPATKGLNLVLGFLIIGAFVLSIDHKDLSAKFIDLASTGLGGYLALTIREVAPKQNL